MKPTLLYPITFLLLTGFLACKKASPVVDTTVEATETAMTYDSVLAQSLGADPYGMKSYVIAFLKTGPTPVTDSVARAEMMRGHLDNIIRLADEGKIALAGPFADDSDYRGIFIFDVKNVEEARALVDTDPAVKSGHLIADLHPWYGSAALLKVNNLHKSIQKESF